ncbi:MAG: transcriptional regulator NrdR [Nitrospira sp.]|nr:transcriptional regulator NrdR [Nitrospira sp.]
MKCPFCDDVEDKVVDSRMAKEGEVIRRRRECLSCKRQYTTYERVEETMPAVVKKDGRQEPFDRSKIVSGLKKACEKRGRWHRDHQAVTDRIEKRIQDIGETEIESTAVGEGDELSSSIRWPTCDSPRCTEFKDIDQFMDEIKSLAQQRRER